MSVYYNESEIPGIAQDIVDREYGGDWGEIKRDMESNDIYRADEKLVYKIQDYMGSFLDVEDEDDDVELLEDLLFYIEDRAKTSHRANRKVAEYDPTNVFQNEGAWEIAEMVWDSRLLSYDVSDEAIEEKIRHYSKTFLGEVADTNFVNSVMNILKENLKQSNRRANRKRASERMNYGDVYTVHSDGSITVHSVGDMEWVSVHVFEEEMNNDYMYDWDAIEAELYEGVASSTDGAEPVGVVPGYFISSMTGVDVDVLADLGPGEYRLCPVSLSYWVGEGEFGDLEHDDGFDYDVVIRY